MERYPMLRLILRFGTLIAGLLGALCALLIIVLGWPSLGAWSVLLGLVAAAFVLAAGKAIVELLTIVTEMLVPR